MVFLATTICVPAISANAAVTYNPTVATMINGVTQAELLPVVNELSGETPAVIGGSPYTILTRGSSSGVPIDMAERYVYEKMLTYGLDSVTYQNYPGKGAVDPGRNVIGQINGTTKASEIVVIGAHLDDQPWGEPRAPGADDNASGVSAMLYLARAFADKTFERTIRFVAFGSEENAPWTSNMYGSGYYAYQAVKAGENIVAMVSADALAYNSSGKTPYIVEMHTRMKNPGLGLDLPIANMWKDVITTYSIANLKPETMSYSMKYSDHGAFWKYNPGKGATLLIEDEWSGENPNWHTVNDTVSTFNWPYYLSVTKSLVGLAAHQAGIVS
jgi:hypothetical protein